MDPDTVKIMIDRGYCMGLHGHRHRSEAAPHSVFTSEEFSMPVVSAGSLCSSGPDLPAGVRRQYNIIEFDDTRQRARLHVREMQSNGAFGRGRLDSAGGRSYVELEWKPVPSGRVVNMPPPQREDLALVEEVERLLALGDPRGAVMALDRRPDAISPYLHRLRINALFRAEQWSGLIGAVGEPQTVEEVTLLVKAMIKMRQWSQVEDRLSGEAQRGLCDPTTLRALREWANAERAIAT